MRKLWFVLLATVIMIVPIALASEDDEQEEEEEARETEGSIRFGDAFKWADLVYFVQLEGQGAQQMRSDIDQRGDGDGYVSLSEAVEHQEGLEAELGPAVLAAIEQNTALDGNAALAVTFSEFEFYYAPGAVDSDEPFLLEIAVRATWKPVDGDQHAFVYRPGFIARGPWSPDVTIPVTVVAPPAHQATGTGETIAFTVSADHTSVTFNDRPGPGDAVVIGFGKTDAAASAAGERGAGTPGPSVAIALLFLGLSAIAIGIRSKD
jgi:hypothetical protein